MAFRKMELDRVVERAIEGHQKAEHIIALVERKYGALPKEKERPSSKPEGARSNRKAASSQMHKYFNETFRLQRALMIKAVKVDHPELVEWLVERGFDINSRFMDYVDDPPLHLACHLGRQQILEIFRRHKPNLMNFGAVRGAGTNNALAFLLDHDDVELIKPWTELFFSRSRIRDRDDRTVLHLVAERGAWNCFRYIVEKHPREVHARDYTGHTVLHIAVRHGVRFVKLLLEHKASVVARTAYHERQCLHMLFDTMFDGPAAYLPPDARDVAELLVMAGADVNALDVKYDTPLNLLCGQLNRESDWTPLTVFPYSIDAHHTIIRDCVYFLIGAGAHLRFPLGRSPVNVILEAMEGMFNAYTGRRRPLTRVTDEEKLRLESSIEFSVELLDLTLRHGANSNQAGENDRTPLTKLFTCLRHYRTVTDDSMSQVYTVIFYIHRTALLLLRRGSRECDLSEVFYDASIPESHWAIISLVLNGLSQRDHGVKLRDVLFELNHGMSSHDPVDVRISWIKQLLQTPRTLRQLARCQIAELCGSALPETTPQLPLPELLQDYVLSFS